MANGIKSKTIENPPTDWYVKLSEFKRQIDWGTQRRAEQFIELLEAAKAAQYLLKLANPGIMEREEVADCLDAAIKAAEAPVGEAPHG